MADFKPRPGSFLPLLESSERKEAAAAGMARSAGSPLVLLQILARQAQQSLPLFDLQTLGNMDPSGYAEALKELHNAGYITIEGAAPEQVISLTAAGAEVVRIA